MALAQTDLPELKRFTFFVSRRFEEGRERFRLHMGYFATLAEAEEWLNVVREIYPGAWAGEAPGRKLRERAAAAAAAQAQHAAGPQPQVTRAACTRRRAPGRPGRARRIALDARAGAAGSPGDRARSRAAAGAARRRRCPPLPGPSPRRRRPRTCHGCRPAAEQRPAPSGCTGRRCCGARRQRPRAPAPRRR